MEYDYNKFRRILGRIMVHHPDAINDDDLRSLGMFIKNKINEGYKINLYRYMPAKYYNIRNLETGKIHLSPNGVMNDIFEGVPVADLTKLSKEQKSIIGESAYITSFSETKDNLLMWSHYADSSKGFCVEYDLGRINDGLLMKIYPVSYSNERLLYYDVESLSDELLRLKQCILNDEEYGEGGIENDICQLLLSKSIDWEYEKEWRLIFTLGDIYKDYLNEFVEGHSVIDFDCVSAVYCGVRCDPEVVQNIYEISQRKSIPFKVYKMLMAENEYKLEWSEYNGKS